MSGIKKPSRCEHLRRQQRQGGEFQQGWGHIRVASGRLFSRYLVGGVLNGLPRLPPATAGAGAGTDLFFGELAHGGTARNHDQADAEQLYPHQDSHGPGSGEGELRPEHAPKQN